MHFLSYSYIVKVLSLKFSTIFYKKYKSSSYAPNPRQSPPPFIFIPSTNTQLFYDIRNFLDHHLSIHPKGKNSFKFPANLAFDLQQKKSVSTEKFPKFHDGKVTKLAKKHIHKAVSNNWKKRARDDALMEIFHERSAIDSTINIHQSDFPNIIHSKHAKTGDLLKAQVSHAYYGILEVFRMYFALRVKYELGINFFLQAFLSLILKGNRNLYIGNSKWKVCKWCVPLINGSLW